MRPLCLKVPEATAECLAGERISCTFRDTIFVKGKGRMRTFWVRLTHDQYIIQLVAAAPTSMSEAIEAAVEKPTATTHM